MCADSALELRAMTRSQVNDQRIRGTAVNVVDEPALLALSQCLVVHDDELDASLGDHLTRRSTSEARLHHPRGLAGLKHELK